MTSIEKAALFAIVSVVLLPRLAWADTVGLLNTFNAGETARASEVNDNFDAVESAVDGNDALITAHDARIEGLESQVQSGIPGQLDDLGESIDFLFQEIERLDAAVSQLSVESQEQQAEIDELARTKAPSVLDGNFELIGTLLGGSRVGDYQGITGRLLQSYVVLSSTDFMFEVEIIDGTIQRNEAFQFSGVYFTESSCQGQAYATDIPLSGLAQGYVFQSRSNVDPTTVYYAEPDSEYVDNPAGINGSAYLTGSCRNSISTALSKVPVFPNDPEITGITNTAFPTPIRIGRP